MSPPKKDRYGVVARTAKVKELSQVNPIDPQSDDKGQDERGFRNGRQRVGLERRKDSRILARAGDIRRQGGFETAVWSRVDFFIDIACHGFIRLRRQRKSMVIIGL